jgi:hypothetical protein
MIGELVLAEEVRAARQQAAPGPCRRCARPLLPGAADCAVCGEPVAA